MKEKINVRLEEETIKWILSQGTMTDVIRRAIEHYRDRKPTPILKRYQEWIPECKHRSVGCSIKKREIDLKECFDCLEREE